MYEADLAVSVIKVQWDRCHQDRRQAWNYINEIAFLYMWKAPARCLRHTNKSRRVSADYLLKNASTKHNKYVLNPKLEHFDKKLGISWGYYDLRINCIFYSFSLFKMHLFLEWLYHTEETLDPLSISRGPIFI